MALFYNLGKILFCLCLTFQGLYIMGVIPGQSNTTLVNTMKKGLYNFQNTLHLDKALLAPVEANLQVVSLAIGGLIALAGLNIFATSRFLIKLNILGLILLTLFVGIPYNAFKGESSFLNPADKTLFHFYANLGLLGGLFYFHSVSARTYIASKVKIQ